MVNKNTIPGDETAAEASGIRLGTPWVTQRGFEKEEMEKIAELIYQVIVNIRPFTYRGITGDLPRGKIELDIIEEVRQKVRGLIQGKEEEGRKKIFESVSSQTLPNSFKQSDNGDTGLLKITGERAKPFLQEVATANIANLKPGESVKSFLLDAEGKLIDSVSILRLLPDEKGRDCYLVTTTPLNTSKVKLWLEGLSDGYVIFDLDDIFAKIEGPVVIEDVTERKKEVLNQLEKSLKVSADSLGNNIDLKGRENLNGLSLYEDFPSYFDLSKPYFIGQRLFTQNGVNLKAKKEEFYYEEKKKVKRSFLYEEHLKLGAKFTEFAGWEMPIYYTSIAEEHRAVRQTAGLFDVSHMGILEVSGEGAADFLDVACTNYVRWLKIGQSQYSFLLDPHANVIDDIMVYCRGKERYMVVCNAANQERVLSWLKAVKSKRYIIDKDYPAKEVKAVVDIRNLKEPSAGKDQKIDIALQGPKSILILHKLIEDGELKDRLHRLEKNEFIEGKLLGRNMIISRTGYTGEEVGFELYLHPEDAPFIWNQILEKGREFKVKPCGLGARDSTRAEAGLPLHGHELAGKYQINPIEAGYGAFVKFHKPFFIGRKALLEREKRREKKVIRFRLKQSYGRMVKPDDPVVDKRGRFIGKVTSCVVAGDFRVGLALVDRKVQEGDEIAVFPLPRGRFQEKPAGSLSDGDRTVLHQEAVVLSRFPEEQ